MIRGLILLTVITLGFGAPVRAQEEVSQPETIIQPSDPASGSDPAGAEWRFIKACGENKDSKVMTAVLPELTEWLRAYPDSEYAADAQFLKASIHLKMGEHRSAIVDLLRHIQKYPGSGSSGSAVKLLNETVDKKMDKKTKLLVAELTVVAEPSEKAERLAALLIKLVERAGEEFYAPLTAEFAAFFTRFPAYPGRDAVQLALADLHNKKQEYLQAKLAYEKLILVYGGSPLLVKAKRAMGNVLANNLKDYDGAINVYKDITDKYPGTEEAWIAYGQLAKLSERQKQYPLAIETYERIISLYPDKDAAYEAYLSEARILREEMSKSAEAIAVLNRLADKYKGEKAIAALYQAAKAAKKDMKDLAGEIKIYDRIASEYSGEAHAPKALFAAAEAYEEGKNFEKAREYFGKVSEKYPEDALSAKAQKRLNAIINK